MLLPVGTATATVATAAPFRGIVGVSAGCYVDISLSRA